MSLRRSFLFIIYSSILFSTQIAASSSWVDVAARDYLDNYSQSIEAANNIRTSYVIGNIDPRLSLKECNSPLTFNFSNPPEKGQRTTIKIACVDTDGWTIYNQVKFDIFKTVWAAKRHLRRGIIIGPQDVERKEVEISMLRGDFISADHTVIGMKLKRDTYSGSPLYSRHLQTEKLIKKGDDVVVSASSSIIAITTKGTALSSGNLGDQITIKNKTSQRILKAIVMAKGKVEIPL